MLRWRITWWCGSIMAGIGTLLNLAVRTVIQASILAWFASFRSYKEFKPSLNSQFNAHIFAPLVFHWPKKPQYQCDHCLPNPLHPLHWGAALHGCSHALLWSFGPEGWRHDWKMGLLLWIILFDAASVGQERDRVPPCQMCCTNKKLTGLNISMLRNIWQNICIFSLFSSNPLHRI